LLKKHLIIPADLKFGIIAAIASALIFIPVLINIIESSSTSTSTSNPWKAINSISDPSIMLNGEYVITKFQIDHAFKRLGSAGNQQDDGNNFVLGNQSLKLSTGGDGLPVFTRKISISPNLDLSEKSINILLKASEVSNIQELRVSVTADRFQTYRDYWIISGVRGINTPINDNDWALITIDTENIRDFGNPDLSKIDTIQLRVVDQGGAPVSVWFNGLSLANMNKDNDLAHD
jgi:hypothetical protein